MKEKEIVEIDPIKAKYNKKLGIFKKISLKVLDFIKKVKSNKSLKEDKEVLVTSFSSIIVYGLTGSIISTLFGFPINVINFFAIGCGLWLFEEKILIFIVKILGSIKFIDISK